MANLLFASRESDSLRSEKPGMSQPSRGLVLSLSVYVVCLTFSINLPTWPSDGAWFFNPLAWQLLLVLGFIGAELARDSEGLSGLDEALDAGWGCRGGNWHRRGRLGS